MTTFINLFGGPGIGKSTVACGVFYNLKTSGVDVERIDEYAKQTVWDKRFDLLQDQCYIFAKQLRAQNRVNGQVEYAVTDSPIIMATTYISDEYPLTQLRPLIRQSWDHFDNINFVLSRHTNYNTNGRMQTELQAIEKDRQIIDMLTEYAIPYTVIDDLSDAASIISNLVHQHRTINVKPT